MPGGAADVYAVVSALKEAGGVVGEAHTMR